VNATTDTISSTAPQQMGSRTPREWLDALSSGSCDPDTFSRAVTDHFQLAPDGLWEIVALLDQYHRLGKIESTLFQHLKSRFQRAALGTDMNGARRASPPSTQGEAAAARAPQVASPPAPPAVAILKPGSEHGQPSADALLRGRYRLGRILERNGVGTLYEATDQDRLDLSEPSRKIAVKILHKTVSGRADSYNKTRREFQYLQSLSHPSILRVHEFDHDGDTVFFSMELLSGLPLSTVLSNRKHLALGRAHAAAIIRSIGDAILHAHGRGVVHGDISPRNIFVTDEGGIRISGFGAAPGAAAGDDVYGIACLACVLLSGYHPFNNRSAAEARELKLKPRRPPGLTYHQWNALRSGLNFSRERRPADIASWLEQVFQHQRMDRLPPLSVLLASAPPRRRFSATHATILVIAIGAAMGVWAQWQVDSMAGVFAAVDSRARRLADSLVSRISDAAPRFAAAVGAKFIGSRSAAAPPTPPLEPAVNAVPTAVSPPPPAIPESAQRLAARASAASAPPASLDTSPSRLELAFETTEVSNASPAALVLIRRRGNLLRDATFTWWTETGTAKPGVDFEAIAPRVETLRAGKDRLNLQIPIVSDPARRQARNFFVVIDQPGPHVSLGSRTVAKISILPPE
jgi:hypothetical protein